MNANEVCIAFPLVFWYTLAVMEEKKAKGFYDRVAEAVTAIPPGKVATYGQIAGMAGSPRGARRVVSVLYRRWTPEMPCHRVVNRMGTLSPPAVFGEGVQRRLLAEEGIAFIGERIDLESHLWVLQEEEKNP